MPASADPRQTLLDPWADVSRAATAANYDNSSSSSRALSSARDLSRHPMKNDALRPLAKYKYGGGSRTRDSEQARILEKYEASVARTLNHNHHPGSHSPAMDIWAIALGVDIKHSKATERARRRVELEEAGENMGSGVWASAPAVPPTTAPNLSVSSNRRVKRGYDTLRCPAGGRRDPIVPEVTALDGFLSELQGRLKSVEGGAVRSSNSTVVPTPSSVRSVGDRGGRGVRVLERAAPGVAVDDEYDLAGQMSLTGLADVYGIPQAFMANAEQVRKGSRPHASLEI